MNTVFDVIILGGGPAGAQCALWLKMLGLNPAVVEINDSFGGLQRQNPYQNNWIVTSPYAQTGVQTAIIMADNMRQKNIDVFTKFTEQDISREHGQFTVSGMVEGGQVSLSARMLVVATGVRHRDGGLKRSERIIIGTGRVIEGYDFSGLNVAILGGGDSAAENYPLIKLKAAKSVKMFARNVRARQNLMYKIPKQNVICGAYDVDQSNISVNGEEFDVLCVMYGWHPVNPLSEDIDCQMDGAGFFVTDQNARTSNSNIYAIGECAGKMHPCVVTAMAEGVVAAKSIQSDFGI